MRIEIVDDVDGKRIIAYCALPGFREASVIQIRYERGFLSVQQSVAMPVDFDSANEVLTAFNLAFSAAYRLRLDEERKR